MHIEHSLTSPTYRPPEEAFTGDVYISDYFQRAAPSRLSGATVTFAPGARTPWKVNPAGQTLVVMSGAGWAQAEGEAVALIRAGDVIWFPPGQRHWEGATPDQAMTYVAVQEGGVKFAEAVSDEEYRTEEPVDRRKSYPDGPSSRGLIKSCVCSDAILSECHRGGHCALLP